MKTIPLGQNALIEVLREDDGVSRTDNNESLKFGRLIRVSVGQYHLTASSFGRIDDDYLEFLLDYFGAHQGCIVRWEEFAEGGQTFEEGGKTYALVPWWRLISIEEKSDEMAK